MEEGGTDHNCGDNIKSHISLPCVISISIRLEKLESDNNKLNDKLNETTRAESKYISSFRDDKKCPSGNSSTHNMDEAFAFGLGMIFGLAFGLVIESFVGGSSATK